MTTSLSYEQLRLDYQRGAAVDAIKTLASEATGQIEAVTSAAHYTPEYKRQKVREIGQQAQAAITEYAEPLLGNMAQEIERLEGTIRLSVVPGETEVQQLAYTRDALAVRWGGMSADDLIADWRKALDAADLITARVYRDFSAPALQAKAVTVINGQPPVVPGYVTRAAAELSDRTDDALMTPEQRQARARLAEIRDQHAQIRMLSAAEAERLGGLRWNGREIEDSLTRRLHNVASL